MLIKSALVTQVSGSIGGMTGSHNRGGMYFRARSIPVNPNSAQQQAIRNAMTALVGDWQATLTPAQRDGWSDYAQSLPVTGKLGDQITLSGINMFTLSNIPRLQAGLDAVLNRPPFNNFGPSPVVGVDSISAASQELDLDFSDVDGWDDEDGSALLVYLSRPQSPSISYFKGPYRLAGVIEGDSTTAPTSPATIDLPFVASVGSVIHGYARLTRADGRLSPITRFLGTVGS